VPRKTQKYIIVSIIIKNTIFKCVNIFFFKTLSISHGPADKEFEGLGTDTGLFMEHDKRGKGPSVNKSSDEVIAKINSHIAKFLIVESHYSKTIL